MLDQSMRLLAKTKRENNLSIEIGWFLGNNVTNIHVQDNNYFGLFCRKYRIYMMLFTNNSLLFPSNRRQFIFVIPPPPTNMNTPPPQRVHMKHVK